MRPPVRESCLHPVDEFLQSDLAVGAFVPLDNGLVAPFLEVLLFDLADLEPGRIEFVILAVDSQSFVVRHLCFVVINGRQFLAGAGLALRDPVTVGGIVVTLLGKGFKGNSVPLT